MKSNKKNKKYKFIAGWINFGIAKKHQEENIMAYTCHIYLRKKDVPDIWGNKQKIILKIKKQKKGEGVVWDCVNYM